MRIAIRGLAGFAALYMLGCGSDPAGTPPTPAPTPTPTTTTMPTGTGTTKPPEPPAFNRDPNAYTLTMYAIPAPSSLINEAGISWKTPGGLVRRTLVNEGGSMFLGFSRTIGHAALRLQCDYYGSKAAAHFQGSMTNVDSKDFNDLVVTKKVGLGMLIDNVPGMIEPEAALQKSLDERMVNGKLAFIRFQISAETCHDLLDYEKSYESENVQKFYGLMARPLYKEGAGCSAFTMSFLELADLIEPRFLQNWSFSVRIPRWTDPLIGRDKPLIGGSMFPLDEVPITRLTTLTRGWATPTEEGVDLFGWDPTQMFDWLSQRTSEALVDKSEVVETMGQARGLVLDRRTKPGSSGLRSHVFFKK